MRDDVMGYLLPGDFGGGCWDALRLLLVLGLGLYLGLGLGGGDARG